MTNAAAGLVLVLAQTRETPARPEGLAPLRGPARSLTFPDRPGIVSRRYQSVGMLALAAKGHLL